MTCSASVDDILKIVDKKSRRDLRYCHLAFAIRADFHSGHYRTSQLGAHAVPYPPTNVGASTGAHPRLGACHSEKQELARSLYGSGSISRIVRPLSNRVEENDRLRSSIPTLVRCGCSYRS